ncbi:MAG: hypothetical protein K2J32_04420 [Ruminococcus sp.]|nr:hypothetical protein [Ruminococcus sp.]
MNTKKLRITAFLMALACITSSCGNEGNSDSSESETPEIVSKSTTTDEIETETQSETETQPETETEQVTTQSNDEILEVCSEIHVTLGGKSCDFEGDFKEITDTLKSLETVSVSDVLINDDIEEWELFIYTNKSTINFSRKLTSQGWLIMDDDMNFYADSPELTRMIIDNVSYGDEKIVTSKEPYFSIECDEPFTEQEYVDTAVECVDKWLTSLQSDDTDEYYRNKSFEITLYDEAERQKCNYLSCGMVDGKKEFVVEICFTAEDYGDNTFYDDYYQEGRYTEAGTFWSGQYICGRFRYDNGCCSLIDMTTRSYSESMQRGLNGIHSGEYKNFYDFARREDYQEILDESFEPRERYTVSRNITMTEDGKPINVDIYAQSVDSETDDSYTAIWYERAYINKEPTYSTGLYFTDNRTGHMPDTLPKDFQLTFDNYDGDANPDFCCRYDSDENGTFYSLDSIQTDGRIFNLSGRAFEGGIYIAGCKDPSPRLQRTETIAYIGWKIDENGRYYPTDSNGNETELPELNMYSDRLYLPDDMKMYGEDENTVHCFLWNNTDTPMTIDNTYSIEISEAGEWRTVAENLKCDSVTIQPREHADIAYDISALSERYNTTYRIVQNSGGVTGYGNFCLAGEDMQNVEVIADPMYSGSNFGSFSIVNYGFNNVDIKSAYILDGNEKYPVNVIENRSTLEYSFICNEMPEKAGKYKLVINDDSEGEIEIKDCIEDFPKIKASSKLDGEKVIVSVESDTDCEVESVMTFRKMNDKWTISSLAPEEYTYEIIGGNSTEIILADRYSEMIDDESLEKMYDMIMEAFEEDEEDYILEQAEEFGITADTDLETFKKIISDYYAFSPESEYICIVSYYINDISYTHYISKLF